jgi:membrane protease YdiL (CAAX protease family)
MAGWVLIYYVVLLAMSTVVWRRRVRSGRSVPGQRLFRALIPRNRLERQWALVGALSAGVFEELLFRGLILAAGLSVGLSPLVAPEQMAAFVCNSRRPCGE